MPFSDLLKEKQSIAQNTRKKYKLPARNKALWLIYIKNEVLLDKLAEWLQNLPANFVVVVETKKISEHNNVVYVNKVPDFSLLWFDFVVWDSQLVQISNFLKNWVVPVIPKDNSMGSVLSDYNAAKSEGNSFLYETENEWNVFYTIARYLENYKFPYDNKNLVKNVFEV